MPQEARSFTRTTPTKKEDHSSYVYELLKHPLEVQRELNNRSLYQFLVYFWPTVSSHTFITNWHLEYACRELEEVAELVGKRLPRKHDLVVNVAPGSSKTILFSIMFPAWCWTKWPWMKFICASYSGALSLESAEYCRELIRSDKFCRMYPDITIKEDKDTKSNYRIVKKTFGTIGQRTIEEPGGGRYSTSVGGTLTGFHGDILVVDDPLNPSQAASDIELANANRWMEQTLSTRKTDKAITPTILVMQRLHSLDPTGNMLTKLKDNVRHLCFPGEIRNFREFVSPPEAVEFYKDDLFDPVRMPWSVLKDLEADLGQYGYAGQIGQNPVPPGGGMFKVDNITIVDYPPLPNNVVHTVRYWDKAATRGAGDYTVGARMSSLTSGKWVIEDVKRGRWASAEREEVIKATAEADGQKVVQWLEQEAGSGGKESSEATIRNLAGYVVRSERPTGDKIFRADPFSVQVNSQNVMMVRSTAWNNDLMNELRLFPLGLHDDIVDSLSGAFSKLTHKKIARRIT
jgi:predicted phage terminase large subunit-like protein